MLSQAADGMSTKGSKSKFSQMSKIGKSSKHDKSSAFNPIDAPSANFNKTMRQVGIQN